MRRDKIQRVWCEQFQDHKSVIMAINSKWPCYLVHHLWAFKTDNFHSHNKMLAKSLLIVVFSIIRWLQKKSQHLFFNSLAVSVLEQVMERLSQFNSALEIYGVAIQMTLLQQNFFTVLFTSRDTTKWSLDFLWIIIFFLWTLLGVKCLMPCKPKLYH